MLDPIFIINIIVAVLNLGIGFVVFSKNIKSKTNQYFLLLTLAIACWILSNFISNIVKSESSAVLWAKLTYISSAILAYIFLLFSLNFPKEIKWKNSFVEVLLGIPSILLLILIIWGNIIGNEVRFESPTIYVSLGDNFFLFPLLFLIYIFFSFVILFKKFIKSDGLEKIQLKFFFIFTFLAVIIAVVLNLMLYWIWEIGYATHFGPLGTIIMVSGLAYAISKHHLFNIRVIATEFLVSIVGIIIFIDLLSSQTNSTRLLKGAILILFGYMAILLLRSVYQEINSRNEAEKLAKEIARLDEAKTQFMLATQHHLRTPLTAIQGYLSMLYEGSWGEINPEAKAKIKISFDSTQKLIKLVNEFLDVAQFEVGKDIMAKKETQIKDSLQDIISELKPEIEKRKLQITLEKPTINKSEVEELPKVMVDPLKIKEAVYNIVNNSIKYTEQGGVTINYGIEADSLKIEIKDTGIGIEKDSLAGLFERTFERGENAKKIYATGRGIGLYLSGQIIKKHGGKIWAESEGLGRGSTFHIELPVNLTAKDLQVFLRRV